VIWFTPVSSGNIDVKIYNLKGTLVWETSKQVYKGIRDIIVWACENTSNETIASGVYVVHVRGAGINKVKKVAVIK